MSSRGIISNPNDLTSQVLSGTKSSNKKEKSIVSQLDDYRKALKSVVDDVENYVAKKQTKLLKDKAKEEKKEAIKTLQETAALENNLFKKFGLNMKATMKSVASNFSDQVKNNISQAFKNTVKAASKGIDDYISTYSQYMGTISARIQGTSLNYNTMMSNISRNLSTSPYVKQTDMISNLNKFVESGITYNIELRSYLATVTDRIATTFNAFDSNLLRIIRIQQADSTTARLGMEALLTQFLNTNFGDTSYLNTSSDISKLLLEAESQMGYKGATEFEYVVQKWLGSMSSVGVSDTALQSIATGLGYLGSGNVSGLSSNTALQNLLVMASSRAGLDYSSMLTGGLTASDTNKLMKSLVNYMQNISTSGNNVVRSELANIFGLTVSDLKSISNLSSSDIGNISNSLMSFGTAIDEVNNQLAQLSTRTSISQKISNVLGNLLTSIGANVATNPVLYGTWEAAKLLESSGLDYKITAEPFGFGISSSLSQIMKTGVVGISGITSLIGALGNLKNAGGTNLSVWGGSETTSRGQGLNPYASKRSSSASSYIGAADSTLYNETFGEMTSESATYTGTQSETSMELMEVVRDKIAVDVNSIKIILEEINLFYNKMSNSNFATAFGFTTA